MAGSSVDVHGLADHDVWDLSLRQFHRHYRLATIFSYHARHRQIVFGHHVHLSLLDEAVRMFGSVPVFEVVALDI